VVYLKLVNATSRPQDVEVAITGAGNVSSTATLVTLSGTNTAETNSISDPRRIIPVKSSIKTGDKFTHTMPAYAVQIVAMDVK
jgi:alpha-N-arabinofuranosidase